MGDVTSIQLDALERRVVELEDRIKAQEKAMGEFCFLLGGVSVESKQGGCNCKNKEAHGNKQD
ncbi:hypothetical protein M0R04_15320 [Candidatus Dojkabacteria bacterium]|jgi:hypothetical protein|nr:hypothetical protein [Candidatus Dojkabacteria bacterium]